MSKNIIRNPIGNHNIGFKRTTNRYGEVGTWSQNIGMFFVSRCAITGQWVKRNV